MYTFRFIIKVRTTNPPPLPTRVENEASTADATSLGGGWGAGTQWALGPGGEEEAWVGQAQGLARRVTFGS